MYKLDLPVDYKEAAAIERRRTMEQARQNRIFNAKTRIIGVDKQGLDQQFFDKKQSDDYENRRDKAFAADAVRNDMIAEMMQKRQNEDVRALARVENEFRALHQQPSSRREFDLYDPDTLKKDKPARVHDDDPRCGVSSLQRFDGEDLNEKARKMYQNEQNDKWFLEQMSEREQMKNNKKTADQLYDLKMRELDERACDLAKAEETCRRAIQMATKDFNLAQDQEKKEKHRLKKQQELDDNFTEIANHIYGDILTENPAVAQSAFGSHRVIPDRWKGMTPAELEKIRKEQSNQILEGIRQSQENVLRDKEWERQQNANAKAGLLLDRENQRLKTEINRQSADENRRLAQEQKARKLFLDREVYTNSPTAAYFMQFNTCSR